jgi:proteasome lid subunit RPN8/RPN11
MERAMAVIVYLDSRQMDDLRRAAARSRDRECCGLLLGTWGAVGPDPAVQIRAVEPMENVWDQGSAAWFEERSAGDHGPSDRYAIDPAQMLAAQRRARDRGWAIVGIYHSHPNGVAVPSECDRQWAWEEYVYAIVAVADGRATDLRFWQLDGQQQFQPLPVTVEGAD